MHEHHRYPDDFEIGDKVKLSALGKHRKVYRFSMRGVVVGHNQWNDVLVNVARPGSKSKVIRPFKPEFLEKIS